MLPDIRTRRSPFPFVGAPAVLVLLALPSLGAPPERFNGQITRPQLEHFLSRAVTMEGLLHEHGDLDDQIRFLKATGTRFAGRTVYRWGGERELEAVLKAARVRERKVHTAVPELMLQAAVFEIATKGVDALAIPPEVFGEFKLPVEQRNFSYDAMLFPSGKFKNHWGKDSSVPDITRPETQMWFYFLAARYIDIGIEAIHFGQVELIGASDRNYAAWDGLLQRVRAYGKAHARRGIIICDAHVPRGGVRVGDRLLFDFHSFPLRIDEDTEHPRWGLLRAGYLDSLFGRSMGGLTPSGWSCEHLPYLVELDNFGRSRKEGQNIGGCWIWGYDEISWFAHLSREDRDKWLRYADSWIREHDPNGHLQMPGSRTLAAPADGKNWYWASNPSSRCPGGFSDEDTIRDIWQKATSASASRPAS